LIESGEIFEIISNKCPDCHYKKNENKNVIRIRMPSSDILEYEYDDESTINSMINELKINNDKLFYLEKKQEILREHFDANLVANFGEEGTILIAIENENRSIEIGLFFGFIGVSFLSYFIYKKYLHNKN